MSTADSRLRGYDPQRYNLDNLAEPYNLDAQLGRPLVYASQLHGWATPHTN